MSATHPHAHASAANPPGLDLPPPAAGAALSVRLLRTPQERLDIAHLRQYADSRSEYEVDPGMASLDSIKDALGMVMAFSAGDEVIATLRVIPSGHGVTLTERWWGGFVNDRALLRAGSWEVGRLVMAPEHRRKDLLPRFMGMGLACLLENAHVVHMHATCHMAMTRLYRRFGFGIHAKRVHGEIDCALIHGPVDQVARALKVAQSAPESAEPVLLQ